MDLWVVALAVLLMVSLCMACRPQAEASTTQPTFSRPEQEPEVMADQTPPEIIGVLDREIIMGGTVSYYDGVTICDDTDPAPSLEVDSTGVDVNTPGCYFITYIATDASGNQKRMAATVTVKPLPEESTEAALANQLADNILSQIITEDMTTRQQVRAIYDWARTNVKYQNGLEHEDWYQAAYVAMYQGKADCFGFFGATKLMFQRLGIPNIDVEKVPPYEGASMHYWSLVSVDGGKNYYHFDSTPRRNQTEDFCLVTDDFLDNYSRQHDDSHNRDKTLYPSTPEV